MNQLNQVLAINEDNEIKPVHIYAKPKQVIEFFYWDCLCEKLGRWPSESEQREFMGVHEDANTNGR